MSQDYIYLLDGTEKKVIIDNVGETDVTYYKYDSGSTETFSIAREKIHKIVYENGIEIELNLTEEEKQSSSEIKYESKLAYRHVIYTPFIPFLVGNLDVRYEYVFSKYHIAHFGVKFYGLYRTNIYGSLQNGRLNSGFYINPGYKFLLNLSSSRRGVQRLNGLFIMPSLIYGKGKTGLTSQDYTRKFGVFVMDLGYQWSWGASSYSIHYRSGYAFLNESDNPNREEAGYMRLSSFTSISDVNRLSGIEFTFGISF